MIDVLNTVNEFTSRGVRLHSIMDNLDPTKAAAELEAGKPLQWRWMEEHQVWRAEIGYEAPRKSVEAPFLNA